MTQTDTNSEFGRGLNYCLGLFLAHAERKDHEYSGVVDYSMWFNGAADHLYEMEIPDFLPSKLQTRLGVFQTKCLHWRLDDSCTKECKVWAIEESKRLLLEIDKEFKIETMVADYE